MTDYPVDNAQSIGRASDNTPTTGTPGMATKPNGGNTVSAPGVATTPNGSLVISVSNGPKATTGNNVSAGML